MSKREVKVGDVVSVTKDNDAVRWDVMSKLSTVLLSVREHGTDYKEQVIDVSMVKQIHTQQESDDE